MPNAQNAADEMHKIESQCPPNAKSAAKMQFKIQQQIKSLPRLLHNLQDLINNHPRLRRRHQRNHRQLQILCYHYPTAL